MSKFVIILVVAVAMCVKAAPKPKAEPNGFIGLEFFPKLPVFPSFPNFPALPMAVRAVQPVESAENIKKLDGGDGAVVYGSFQSSSSSQKVIDGKVVEDTYGGHSLTNNNGQVEEHFY